MPATGEGASRVNRRKRDRRVVQAGTIGPGDRRQARRRDGIDRRLQLRRDDSGTDTALVAALRGLLALLDTDGYWMGPHALKSAEDAEATRATAVSAAHDAIAQAEARA